MEKLTKIDALAAPLREDGIDTDSIYPARFLLKTDKHNMGECLFYDRRILKNGAPDTAFILNQADYQHANVLLVGRNFGCGSSREHAVWALRDYGISAIIAESFGEIFYMNCINNQVLPIRLPASICEELAQTIKRSNRFQIDLVSQTIQIPSRPVIAFDIATEHRRMLLEGLDEISIQLEQDIDDIEAFEGRQQQSQPWLWFA